MTKREKQLLEEGWEKRTVADEPRLSELVETYESLGFSVIIEPVPTKEEAQEAGNCGDCLVCFDNDLRHRYKIIYTRKKQGAAGSAEMDELF